VKRIQKDTENHIRALEAKALKARKKLQKLNEIKDELTLLEENNIFFGSKSRQYRRKTFS
jgi:hypothetical protein